jgi:hypothetical protein
VEVAGEVGAVVADGLVAREDRDADEPAAVRVLADADQRVGLVERVGAEPGREDRGVRLRFDAAAVRTGAQHRHALGDRVGDDRARVERVGGVLAAARQAGEHVDALERAPAGGGVDRVVAALLPVEGADDDAPLALGVVRRDGVADADGVAEQAVSNTSTASNWFIMATVGVWPDTLNPV